MKELKKRKEPRYKYTVSVDIEVTDLETSEHLSQDYAANFRTDVFTNDLMGALALIRKAFQERS